MVSQIGKCTSARRMTEPLRFVVPSRNPTPRDPQTNWELRVVPQIGIEPTTSSLGRNCSIQLSYQGTYATTSIQIELLRHVFTVNGLVIEKLFWRKPKANLELCLFFVARCVHEIFYWTLIHIGKS